MTDEMTDFRWTVAAAGYRWIETNRLPPENDAKHRFLTSAVPTGTTYSGFSYSPLRRYSGLFRVFSSVNPTEVGVLAFADQYGLLGGAASEQIAVCHGPNPGSQLMGHGERLAAWKQEIAEMKAMLTVWDAIQAKDLVTLSSHVRWSGADAVLYESPRAHGHTENALIASENIYPELLSRFQPGDLFTPAVYLLQRKINEALQRHAVVARLLWGARRTTLALHVVPSSLIGCLWLQFAKAVEGEKHYRQCDNCRLWFEVGGNRTARSDKRFCSPTCKASAHRKKQTEARNLHGSGVPIKEVASRLGTTTATVKGWVK